MFLFTLAIGGYSSKWLSASARPGLGGGLDPLPVRHESQGKLFRTFVFPEHLTGEDFFLDTRQVNSKGTSGAKKRRSVRAGLYNNAKVLQQSGNSLSEVN